MALDPDPYRTLGLKRGASLDEVKRAYRRLAKINHPDAAGEAALPRFLAIQAAYEQLAGPASLGKTRRPTAAPRRPWDAEADKTRRAYGGRARNAPPGAAGAGGGATGKSGAAGEANPSGAIGRGEWRLGAPSGIGRDGRAGHQGVPAGGEPTSRAPSRGHRARRHPAGKRAHPTRRHSDRRRTTGPTPGRSSPTGAGPTGTARPAARTGR